MEMLLDSDRNRDDRYVEGYGKQLVARLRGGGDADVADPMTSK